MLIVNVVLGLPSVAPATRLGQTCVLGHTVEGGLLVCQELGGRSKFRYLAFVQNKHLIRVHDRV